MTTAKKSAAALSRRGREHPGRGAIRANHREGLVGIIIRDFPLPLKKRIGKAAEAAGTNSQDLVVVTLASTYRVKYMPSGRKSTGLAGDSTQMYFAVPRLLRRKINQEAARREISTKAVIIEILEAKFSKK